MSLAAIAFFYVTVLLVHPAYLSSEVWDEEWYHNVAANGYTLEGGTYLKWQNPPFSPGLPLVTRFSMWLTGWSYPPIRSLLSALFFVLGCIGVHRVLALYSDRGRKHYMALAFFAFWPGSAYFLSGYSESLYLPLLAWCLYALLRQRMLMASVLAAFALFTRSPAIILAPLLVFACAQRAWASCEGKERWRAWIGSSALHVGIMSLGMLGFMAMLWVDLGDPLAFRKAYAGWVPYVHTGADKLLWQSFVPCAIWSAEWAGSIFMAMALYVAMPLLVFPMRRQMPPILFAFLVVGWCFFLLMDRHHRPFMDILRWIVVFFPLCYCVAQWTESLARKAGALLAGMRMGNSTTNARVMGWMIDIGILLGLLSFQAYIIARYIRNEWVS